MEHRFTANEWYALPRDERVRRCHLMADESRQLADRNENIRVKDAYLTLATQWLLLAAEIEREPPSGRA
jgi:hypothetical protein